MDPGGARTIVEIGHDIHEWCIANRVTKNELADVLGVDEKTVYNLWYGVHAPSGPVRRALAMLMDKPLDFFIESCDPMVEDRIKDLEQKIKSRNGGKKERLPSLTKEDELDRRLDAAVNEIKAEKRLELKEHLVLQCELVSQTAKLMK